MRIALSRLAEGRGLLDRIGQLVKRRHCLVELQPLNRLAHRRGRACNLLVEGHILISAAGRRCRKPPYALDEPRRAFDSANRPFKVALGRRIRQHEPAHRIGPVTIEDRSGSMVFFFDLDIFSMRPRSTSAPVAASITPPPSLTRISSGESQRPSGALVRLVGHHPWVKRPLNGSLTDNLPIRSERACPEARVEQVEDRMLDPANILPDRKPRLGFLAVERRVAWLAGEADEIPGGIDERIERIGLAPRRAATGRAITLPHVEWRSSGLPGTSKLTSSGRTIGN
jgi:hypothetical protein